MKTDNLLNIAYPLISGPEDEHSWMCYLSAVTARHFHPGAGIFCICDDRTRDFLQGTSHPLCRAATIVSLGDLGVDRHLASRRAKFRAHRIVGGPCIELDADTVFLNPVEGFFPASHQVAICRDQVDAREMGRWLDPVFRDLGWAPLAEYFNSGVLFFGKDFAKTDFFQRWEDAYLKFVTPRRRNDQPALAHVVKESDCHLVTLPQRYNFPAYLAEKGRNRACILHFWASDRMAYSSSRYASIVRLLRRNHEMSPAKIMRLLRSRRPLFFGNHLHRHMETGDVAGFAMLAAHKLARRIRSNTRR